MSTIGTVHVVFAFAAIAAGALVLLLPKGTRWHRTVGHAYATSMVGLIATAFAIYDLFGGFGPFHVAAVVSGATLLPGMGFALLRRPRGRWMPRHAAWMVGSYIGLMCAFAAETTTRWIMPRVAPLLPEALTWPVFWGAVVVASAGVGWLGGRLASRHLPRSLARTPAAMRAERAPATPDAPPRPAP
ncbi:MAG: DUF2306 domain-containing protein [Gemmatimonadetes bacterium]|nr:DUF2306 domain-containing protein [Gemmatimonadota bacterium]